MLLGASDGVKGPNAVNYDPTLFRHVATARQQDLLAEAARDRRPNGLAELRRLTLPSVRAVLRLPARAAAVRPGASA